MADTLVRILDGNTFVVSDTRGDIEASRTDPTGLFSYDTRFLSRWVLTVNGERLEALSIDDVHYFETRFFLVPGTGTVYVDSKVSVVRQRAVTDGFEEEITILNHGAEPLDVHVRIEAASDFADLFEVKDALTKKGDYSAELAGGTLILRYERETFVRETMIAATGGPTVDDRGLTFDATIAPQGRWKTDIDVRAGVGVEGVRWRTAMSETRKGHRPRRGRSDMENGLNRWLAGAPSLECDSAPLQATYQ